MDVILATTQSQDLAPFLESLEIKTNNKSLENGPIESNAHIAIAFNVLHSETKLTNLTQTLKSGGFIITSEANSMSESVIEKTNLVFISKLSAENKTFYLLRKVRPK